MEYKEYKDLEDHLNDLSKYNQKEYYRVLLLKSIYDKLNTIEKSVEENNTKRAEDNE